VSETEDSGNRGGASVRSAALWAAGGQYVLFVLQFATSVVISRFFLRPEEIGLFSVALAAAMIVAIIRDLGITRYIGRHPTADNDTVRHCTMIAVLFSFVIGAVILALAGPAAHFYGEPRLFGILALIAASYVLAPWSIVPVALLSRRLDFRATFAVDLAGAVANSACAVTLAVLGFSAESLAWAMIAQAAMRAIMAQSLRPTPFSFRVRLPLLREIAGFGSGSAALYFSGGISLRMPDLIVGRMLGMEAAGLFSRGVSLAASLHSLVVGAVSAVYYPAFARLRDEGRELGPYYERVVAAHGAIVWPAMVLMAVLSHPIILLLYGPGWDEAAPLLAWVALAECCFVMLPLHMDLPILTGRLRQLLWFNLADTALAIALLAAGAMMGLEAAAASRVVWGLGWFAIYAGWMQRIVGFGWNRMLRIYLSSAALAGMTALPALAALYLWRTPGTLGLDGFVVAGLASGLAWVAGVFLLCHPARDDMVSMVTHAIQPVLNRLRPQAV
jgi:O-antigen/teichoic acid export membrane protein